MGAVKTMGCERTALPHWLRTLLPGEWVPVGHLWVGLVTVHPDAAEIMLKEHNGRNRPYIAANLERIKQEIGAGEFALTGETGIIDWDGEVVDFQHRLRGCLEAKVAIRMLVVYGVDPAVFKYIDQGAKRTIGHNLARCHEQHYCALAAALTCYHTFSLTGRICKTAIPRRQRLNVATTLETLSNNPEIRESVKRVQSSKQAKTVVASRVGGHSVLSAFHYITSRVDPALSNELFDRLSEQRFDGDRWQPARLLSVRLGEAVATRGRSAAAIRDNQRLAAEVASALLVKTWNAVRCGTEMRQLKWAPSTESYPEVSGWIYTDGKPSLATEPTDMGGE